MIRSRGRSRSVAVALANGGGGGGGGATRPAWMDTDAVFLFDAHDGITLSGSDVTAWADQGPAGLVLSQVPSAPVNASYDAAGIGTGPAVLCGTYGMYAAGVTLTSAAAVTVIAVLRAGGNERNALSFALGSFYGLSLRYASNAFGARTTLSGDGDAGGSFVDAVQATADEYLVATIGTSATRYMRRDGSDVTNDQANGATNYSSTTDLYVGVPLRSRAAVDAIGLMCVVPRELTSEELAAAEAYCAAAWGL